MDDFKPQQPQQQPTDKPEGDFQSTYENKPETYVTPSGEPTTLNTAPQQPALAVPKKKSGAKKWLVAGLVLVLLGGLGAFAYWQWSEADTAKQELSSAQSQLETAQADLSKLDAGSNAGADEPVSNMPTITTQTLLDKLVAAIKNADATKTLVVTPGKVEGDFATIFVRESNSGGGFVHIYKKSNDVLVEIERYNSEDNFLPKLQADMLKSRYGFDAKAYGIDVK